MGIGLAGFEDYGRIVKTLLGTVKASWVSAPWTPSPCDERAASLTGKPGTRAFKSVCKQRETTCTSFVFCHFGDVVCLQKLQGQAFQRQALLLCSSQIRICVQQLAQLQT